MKTDFTERLRNFLKDEGLKCRLLVSYDDNGNVCKVIANIDHDEGNWWDDLPQSFSTPRSMFTQESS